MHFFFLFFFETRKQYKVGELAGIRYPTSCPALATLSQFPPAGPWSETDGLQNCCLHLARVAWFGEDKKNLTWFICFSSYGWWFCARGIKKQPSPSPHRHWEAYGWHQQAVKAVLMLPSGSHKAISSFLTSACSCFVQLPAYLLHDLKQNMLNMLQFTLSQACR